MKKIALTIPAPTPYVISGPIGFKTEFTNIGAIISALLPYLFVLAGIILLFMLIAGGFGLLTSAGNPEKIKAAWARITSALIGFLVIFCSYWLIQILGVILGMNILG
jgi:hypothetical protein